MLWQPNRRHRSCCTWAGRALKATVKRGIKLRFSSELCWLCRAVVSGAYWTGEHRPVRVCTQGAVQRSQMVGLLLVILCSRRCVEKQRDRTCNPASVRERGELDRLEGLRIIARHSTCRRERAGTPSMAPEQYTYSAGSDVRLPPSFLRKGGEMNGCWVQLGVLRMWKRKKTAPKRPKKEFSDCKTFAWKRLRSLRSISWNYHSNHSASFILTS